MSRITRRDLIATIGTAAALLASRAHAACDVFRDSVGGVSTRSYFCDVPGGGALTATFMRLSDVMFDSVGGETLPGRMGELQGLVRGHRMVDTPALAAFTRLFEAHSFAFEPANVEMAYDMRGEGQTGEEVIWDGSLSLDQHRWRTLGVWDETLQMYLPAFPLPDLLRRSLANRSGEYEEGFLRHAVREDFSDLDAKTAEYAGLWRERVGELAAPFGFGNITMLADIDAGSVPGFVPIFLSTSLTRGDCDGVPYAGTYYLPPALHVDVAVCRNDGARTVEIEDMFGAADPTERLRLYDPATPPGAERFGWDPVALAPGQSVLVVQRLLFGARRRPATSEPISSARAVYGPTHLPKGVVVGGETVPFDGRSHNAVILSSFAGCCSCPYLESWCPRAGEWIDHGKVLTRCDAPHKASRETIRFGGVRSRFRLSEREHEDTFLTGAALDVYLADGTVRRFVHPGAAARLSLGQSVELDFDLPAGVTVRAVSSALTLAGHYEKFRPTRVEALAAAAS